MALRRDDKLRFLSVEEVAGTFGVNAATVYRLVKARQIPAVKIGGQWRFSQVALDAWVASRMTVSPQRFDKGSSARTKKS